ncbi:hypothetical protein TNCT_371811, partial [Trichonephila clavata]
CAPATLPNAEGSVVDRNFHSSVLIVEAMGMDEKEISRGFHLRRMRTWTFWQQSTAVILGFVKAGSYRPNPGTKLDRLLLELITDCFV